VVVVCGASVVVGAAVVVVGAVVVVVVGAAVVVVVELGSGSTAPTGPAPITNIEIMSANTAPLEAAMQAGLRDVVKDILDSLTPREAKVLRMRFGIEMSTDHTLEEVGKQFDVTRERIRQIEAKALRKLKHPSRSDKLRSFIDMQ
jgi:DNA-binding CsgD family transcriptional regulator